MSDPDKREDDDDIEFDFSKVKKFFSGKKEASVPTEQAKPSETKQVAPSESIPEVSDDDDLDIDFGKVKKFYYCIPSWALKVFYLFVMRQPLIT